MYVNCKGHHHVPLSHLAWIYLYSQVTNYDDVGIGYENLVVFHGVNDELLWGCSR